MKSTDSKCFFLIGFICFINLIVISCSFFSTTVDEITGKNRNYTSEITGVTLSSSELNLTVGESEYLKVTLNPSAYQGKCSVYWDYDDEYLDCKNDNFGSIMTPKKIGTTFIKVKCNTNYAYYIH